MARKTRISILDLVVLIGLAAAAVFIAYRVRTGLEYDWNWAVIPQYLVRYDAATGDWKPNLLILGLATTLKLSLWATFLATVLGAAMGICRSSRILLARMIGRTYVELVRNLPPLILVFIFFYFISEQVLPVLGLGEWLRGQSPGVKRLMGVLFASPARFDAFIAAVVTLAIYEGAYITEIVRAGIESIEKSQWDAAYALGLSRGQQMLHVILPQAAQRVLPPLAGQFISTIKDSAIVSIISIQELTFQGMELTASTYLTFEIWITVTVLYLVLTLTCSLLARKLETHLARSR